MDAISVFEDDQLGDLADTYQQYLGLAAVKNIVIFYWISRPRDISHLVRADFLSNLPHRMAQMLGYEAENDPGPVYFSILRYPSIFTSF